MKVGNTYYIVASYNETKFQLLLENHLKNKRKEDPLSDELIEECLAAFLELNDSTSNGTIDYLNKMIKLLNKAKIQYSDCRGFTKTTSRGSPLEAVKAFNMLFHF